MAHGPLVLRPALDPAMWVFVAGMLRNCTAARYARNKARMVPLAEYSRDVLRDLRALTGIAYDERSLGTLQLFRTEKQVHHAAGDIAVLKQFGVPYALLDPDGCVAAEPALAAVRGKFAGGLRLPGDETGDCHMFTERLAALAAGKGVRFRFETTVGGLIVSGGRVTGAETSAGPLAADAVVVALGSYSTRFLRPAGLSLSVYPIKGYSITVPVADASRAPQSTVMDETYKVAITRLGDRIRVGGTAEVAGYDLTLRKGRRAPLVHSLTDLFPGAGHVEAATFWTGLRPMTPEGPPLLGATRLPGLYVNTGHGTLGWTMACGSGRVLADLVSGKAPEVSGWGAVAA
jgi:D-amino-acid dehydrogenase